MLFCDCLALLKTPQRLPIAYWNGKQNFQPLMLAFRDLILNSVSRLSLTVLHLNPNALIHLDDYLVPLLEFSSSVPKK